MEYSDLWFQLALLIKIALSSRLALKYLRPLQVILWILVLKFITSSIRVGGFSLLFHVIIILQMNTLLFL